MRVAQKVNTHGLERKIYKLTSLRADRRILSVEHNQFIYCRRVASIEKQTTQYIWLQSFISLNAHFIGKFV